jgi:hypothetical protein
MKAVHFYSSKISGVTMLGISLIFTLFFIKYDLGNKNMGTVIMLNLGFVLVLFGGICSLLLLLRRKPLLTITDQQIIIYNLIKKPRVINLEDVSSFYESNQKQRMIKTAEFVHIVMKDSQKNKNSFQKESLKLFPNNEVIHADILNVKTKTLLELLNNRLISFNNTEASGVH